MNGQDQVREGSAQQLSEQGGEIRSPAQIHRVLVVVRRRSWIPLAALMVLAVVVVVLLFVARIPTIAVGRGILLRRATLVPLQALAGGRIAEWKVQVGDEVHPGTLLALLAQPELEQALQQAEERLALLLERQQDLRRLDERADGLEQATLEQRERFLEQRAAALETQVEQGKRLVRASQPRTIAFLRRQARDLRSLITVHERRARELEEQSRRRAAMADRRLLSQDALVQVGQAASEQRLRLAELQLQLQQLGLKKIQAREDVMDRLQQLARQEDEAAALRLELKSLARYRASQARQDRASEYRREADEADLRRTAKQYRSELEAKRRLVAEHDGRIIELCAPAGRFVEAGERLGTLDTGSPQDLLEAVAYFPLEVGKRIEPGMTVRLFPVTVDRDRFGSLIGQVREVASYPVSPEAAAQVVGLAGVAGELTGGAASIQLFAGLEIEEGRPGRYRWSLGEDPEVELSSGTLVELQVYTERKRPVGFVLPIFSQ
ncbi:MAG: NHLP bacteriocin system secretion protein [Deltaproteobacteria bacterium]|nr:NHLP bacteriocin system secretion protein [Deltaproteobacteria bacterium]